MALRSAVASHATTALLGTRTSRHRPRHHGATDASSRVSTHQSGSRDAILQHSSGHPVSLGVGDGRGRPRRHQPTPHARRRPRCGRHEPARRHWPALARRPTGTPRQGERPDPAKGDADPSTRSTDREPSAATPRSRKSRPPRHHNYHGKKHKEKRREGERGKEGRRGKRRVGGAAAGGGGQLVRVAAPFFSGARSALVPPREDDARA
ncbi:hypothetical protein SEVIR_2G366450v4 [Setaria viridis]